MTESSYEGTSQKVCACRRATGRERVLAQADDGVGNGDAVDVAGLEYALGPDRAQLLHPLRPVQEVRPAPDRRAQRTARAGHPPDLVRRRRLAPGGPSGRELAVTSRGIAAWTAEDGARRLLAAAPGGGVTELDRGAIDGLREQGTAVAWTRDGEPRSAELP